MAKANLDLCFVEVLDQLENTVGIPAANIERGRRPRNVHGYPWAFVRSRAASRTDLVTGAATREYEIEVDLMTRTGDVQEGTAVAGLMETLQELLFDAFNAKTAADYPLLIGLRVIEVEQVTRDDIEDEENSTERSMSRTVIRFPFWETL